MAYKDNNFLLKVVYKNKLNLQILANLPRLGRPHNRSYLAEK